MIYSPCRYWKAHPLMGYIPSGFCKTRTCGCGYRFWRVRVRVAWENPRVARDIPYSLRSSCQNFVWSPGYSSCLGYLSYSTNKSPSDWMLHRQMDFQHQVQCSLYHCPLQACVWRSHPLPWMLWQSHQADNTPKHFNQTLQLWLVCFRKHVLLYKLINVMQIPCRHFTYFKGRHSICSPSTPLAPLKLLVKQLSLPDASPATSIFFQDGCCSDHAWAKLK